MSADFHGLWRITEVQEMDLDDLEARGEATIRFDEPDQGEFQFYLLNGSVHYRPAKRSGHPVVEFSWEGDNDGQAASGWGWVTMKDDDNMVGLLYVHFGREFSFVAHPIK